MPSPFLEILSTPSVRAARDANGSRAMWEATDPDRAFDRFTADISEFIAARDSFYMATVSESGWPYVQHRGGPPGFIKVLDPTTLAIPDFAGNRQYLSLGHLGADDRAALIMVDYPRRARLKLLVHIAARDLDSDPDLAARLALPGYRGRPERALLMRLESFDWNCPQHITPRFTKAEIDAAVAPLHARIAALEAANRALRTRLDDPTEKESHA